MEDPGKTTGIIARLNKLSQHLAGLLVGVYGRGADRRGVILVPTLGMGLIVVTEVISWCRLSASALDL